MTIRHNDLTGAELHEPKPHTASHTDGTDDVQNATSAQKGLATSIQITKLDGIETAATKYPGTGEQAFLDADHTKLNGVETLADVTDAANVGSAISGTAEKSSPVNADSLALIDSAAGDVLKELTLTDLKAFLKTYFDTLYASI